MKFLIVMIACLAMASAGELMKEQLDNFQDQCVSQEGITKDQAMALRDGKFDDSDQKVKCFSNCMMEKLGFMVDGQFKPDAVMAKIGPIEGADSVKAFLAKCGSIKGTDKCDTSYQHFICFHKNRATAM